MSIDPPFHVSCEPTLESRLASRRLRREFRRARAAVWAVEASIVGVLALGALSAVVSLSRM